VLILAVNAGSQSSACLLLDGRVIAAVEEERLTRKKNQGGFPSRAIDAVLAIAGATPADVDLLAYPERSVWDDVLRVIPRRAPGALFEGAAGFPARVQAHHALKSLYALVVSYRRRLRQRHEARLRACFVRPPLRRVEHHLAHTASAYLSSPFEEAINVSMDGWGNYVCTMVSIGRGDRIAVIEKSHWPNSVGSYYAILTQALGFRPVRHEGKVTGLAGYGDPDGPAYAAARSLLVNRGLKVLAPATLGRERALLAELLRRHSREDVAAGFQRRLEEVSSELVRRAVRRFGIRNVTLSGGVAANVRMNQRILETEGVERVFVYPAMHDGGLSVGAALAWHHRLTRAPRQPISHVYYGPRYSEVECEAALVGIPRCRPADLEAEVAALLAAGKVVARFDGAMEFGPRALGNRSVLCQATDPNVNDWLNRRLGRTEFMPFAPATLAEEASQCFLDVDRAALAGRFMTITSRCTEYMRATMPAAVHVDGTARPQFVERASNPSFHRILSEYRRVTTLPALINTSFNMHEEPIVCTPADAVRAFQQAELDALAIGPFLVERRM